MTDPLILAFDTSGAYCSVALQRVDEVIATRHVETHKGQAEQLFPLIQQVLGDADVAFSDLTRIGVGTGPGNFTGIRISVASARGLGVSLHIPVIGVTAFEALSVGSQQPILASLQAPRDQVYVQEISKGWRLDPIHCPITDIPTPQHARICTGHRSDEIATQLGLTHQPAKYAPATAIARFAASAEPGNRPAPFYLRPADAAPPRDPAPVILS